MLPKRNKLQRLSAAVAAALLLPAQALADTGAVVESDALEHVHVRETAKQHTSNYTVPASSAATGMKLTQRETPQSLSVMTERQIEDQSLDTLQEALKQTPGLYHSKMGNNATGDSNFASRGIPIDSITVDGKSKFFYESNNIRRATNNLDSALYEEITVIRGASGLANGGMGETGGTITLTRKQPRTQSAVSIGADLGSWRHTRLNLDANGALNSSKTLLGRAVIVSDHGGDYLPRSSRHNHTLYGVLAYDLSPQTRLSTGAEIHADRSSGSSRFSYLTIAGNEDDGFAPFDASPRNNSSARWAYSRDNSSEIFASVKHEFDNGWTLKGDYSYTQGRYEQLSGIAGPFVINRDFSGEFNADFGKGRLKEHNFSLKLDGSYPLFGRRHDFSAGIGYLQSKDKLSVYRDIDLPIKDLRRFDGNIAKPEFEYQSDGFENTRNLTASAATRLRLTDRWSLLAGGRYTRWQYHYATRRNKFADDTRTSRVFIPYLGTTYDFTPHLAAYASYTTVFRPQVHALDINGNPLDPQRGKTYEAGIKGAWYGGRLNAAAAVFLNRRDGLAVKAGKIDKRDYYRAENHTKNKGWELSLGGRLNERWLINTSYARSKTRDSKGNRIETSYPVHLFKLFTSYDVTDRLTLGGNVNWQSQIDTIDEYAPKEPAARAALAQRAYATLDLSAKYRLGKSTFVSLYAENVFDKKYKTMHDIHVYGTPRSYTFSVKHTF